MDFMYKRCIPKSYFIKILVLFIVILIGTYLTFISGIYKELSLTHPEAGLAFFYELQDTTFTLWFPIMVLIMPSNLLGISYLKERNNKFSNFIKIRIGSKRYFKGNVVCNAIHSFVLFFTVQLVIVLVIHFFLIPIVFNFNTGIESNQVYEMITKNRLLNLILYIIFSSFGFTAFSTLILSIKNYFKNEYVYRGASLLLGLILIALPAILANSLYLLFNSEIILNLFMFIFLPTLISPGVQGISIVGIPFSPMVGFVFSFVMYLLVSILLFYKTSKKELQYG